MKNLWLVALFIIVSTLVVINGTFANAEEGEYLGDFCWSFEISEGGTGAMKLGCFHTGGGHFILSGVVISTNGIEQTAFASAEVIGNELHMTATCSSARTSSTVHAKLDLATLNGTADSIGWKIDDNGNIETDSDVNITISFINWQ